MREIKDQVQEIKRRREILREKSRLKKRMAAEAVCACSLLLLLVIPAFLPADRSSVISGTTVTQYGSLLLPSSAYGTVLTGILAFLLGVTVTLLCLHWKKWKSFGKEEEQETQEIRRSEDAGQNP